MAGEAELRLAWVDKHGERHAYGSVAPHGRRLQKSWAGHVWEAAVVSGEQQQEEVAVVSDAHEQEEATVVSSGELEQEATTVRYRVGRHPSQVAQVGEDLAF